MLQLALLREKPEEVALKLQKKGFDASGKISAILELDKIRRTHQKELDESLAASNLLAKQIGAKMAARDTDGAEKLKGEVSMLKSTQEDLKEKLAKVDTELGDILVLLPNLPHHLVPEGRLPENNLEVDQWGTIPTIPANAKPHWELMKDQDMVDLELGVKLTGAGFPVYKGLGAKLQRALINYFLDKASLAGFLEHEVPVVVNAETMFATGQLPDKEGQMYHINGNGDNLYLIPTAEVPLTNLYRDLVVEERDLPIRLTGYTPCFRREAGSYGKDVRGLNRLHQFDKVEIVMITKPEESYDRLEEMREYVGTLLQELGLHYRVLRLCGGDMSFGSAMTYDFEVWSAAQKRWLEVSSVSNFETFQSNRLKLRYRPQGGEGKPILAHTLNGSALALPRIVASIMEQYQTELGTIDFPEVLKRYLGM